MQYVFFIQISNHFYLNFRFDDVGLDVLTLAFPEVYIEWPKLVLEPVAAVDLANWYGFSSFLFDCFEPILPIVELDFCLRFTRFRFITWISCFEKCPLRVYSSRAFCCDGSALTNLDCEPLLEFEPIIWPSYGVDIEEIRKLPLPVDFDIGVCSTISPNGPLTFFVCLY